MSNGTIDWTLGLKVRITTLLDNTITGTVYAFCQTTNTITLIEDAQGNADSSSTSSNAGAKQEPPKRPNYRIVKTSFVRDVTVLSKSKKPHAQPSAASVAQGTLYKDAFAKAEPPIGRINIGKLAGKADAAILAERKRRSRIGVGVTKEAQAFFDLLSKTVPCIWHGKSIIAMEEVRIDPPYTPESCIADDPKSTALAYVKRLVEGTKEKLTRAGSQIKGG